MFASDERLNLTQREHLLIDLIFLRRYWFTSKVLKDIVLQ